MYWTETGRLIDYGTENGTVDVNGTGAEAEAAYWSGCWLVDEGDAGRAAGTSVDDCAAGRSCRRRFLQSHVLGEGERRTAGSAGEEVWRVGEQEAEEAERRGRRGVEWSESRQSCGC